MENLDNKTQTDLQYMGNVIKAKHDELKKSIIADTYEMEELEKRINKNVKSMIELEKNYVEIVEKIVE